MDRNLATQFVANCNVAPDLKCQPESRTTEILNSEEHPTTQLETLQARQQIEVGALRQCIFNGTRHTHIIMIRIQSNLKHTSLTITLPDGNQIHTNNLSR